MFDPNNEAFANSVTSFCKQKLQESHGLPPLVAVGYRDSEEQAMFFELAPELVSSRDNKKILRSVVEEIKETDAELREYFCFCTESWVTAPETPKDYLEMVTEGILQVGELPLRYRLEALSFTLIHTPEFGDRSRWQGRWVFHRAQDGTPINWGDLCWENSTDWDVGGLLSF